MIKENAGQKSFFFFLENLILLTIKCFFSLKFVFILNHSFSLIHSQFIMRIYLLLFLSVILMVGVSACKTTKNAQAGATKSNKKVKVPADFAFSMERTSCRGTCPGFKLSVDNQGNVQYEGDRNVKNIGKFTKTLSSDQLKSLVAAINDGKYWDFADKYDDENIADPPSCTMICTMNGKKKQIFDRFKAPQELRDLEAKIEGIIGEEGYSKQ